MNGPGSPIHTVCTHGEAERLLHERARFWVSTCRCRESRGYCARSPLEVCVSFRGDPPGGGTPPREITREEVMEVLRIARDRLLVCRPFRDLADRALAEGICFCCDDCCSYFLDPAEPCDRGSSVEVTEMGLCCQCDACVPVCHFGARTTGEGGLCVDGDRCFGCGLCERVCPVGAVRMAVRPQHLPKGTPGMVG